MTLAQKSKARTAQIVVGKTYFLSQFFEKHGAMVKVLEVSTKINRAGWPSSIKYQVTKKIGDKRSNFYSEGRIGTCNACNLYEKREQASHKAIFAKS